MIVTLIGYRGSGKTSVARLLAARWEWSFLDADEEIERRAGRTIREIFAESGESEFRRLERAVISELLQREALVLAAGGGAVLNAETCADIQAAGPVVWLQASVDVLAQRIQSDASTASRRPHLTVGGGRREIEQVLAAREPLYRQCASLVVDTDNRLLDDIAGEIARSLDPVVRRGDAP